MRAWLRWTIIKRDEMNKLGSTLDSHKAAIEIALNMVNL